MENNVEKQLKRLVGFSPIQGFDSVDTYYKKFCNWKQKLVRLNYQATEESFVADFVKWLQWDIYVKVYDYRSELCTMSDALTMTLIEETMLLCEEEWSKGVVQDDEAKVLEEMPKPNLIDEIKDQVVQKALDEYVDGEMVPKVSHIEFKGPTADDELAFNEPLQYTDVKLTFLNSEYADEIAFIHADRIMNEETELSDGKRGSTRQKLGCTTHLVDSWCVQQPITGFSYDNFHLGLQLTEQHLKTLAPCGLYLVFQALDKYVVGQGCLPVADLEEDAHKYIYIVNNLYEIFGDRRLENARLSVVGSGALGYELLKNLVLLGVSCGRKGKGMLNGGFELQGEIVKHKITPCLFACNFLMYKLCKQRRINEAGMFYKENETIATTREYAPLIVESTIVSFPTDGKYAAALSSCDEVVVFLFDPGGNFYTLNWSEETHFSPNWSMLINSPEVLKIDADKHVDSCIGEWSKLNFLLLYVAFYFSFAKDRIILDIVLAAETGLEICKEEAWTQLVYQYQCHFKVVVTFMGEYSRSWNSLPSFVYTQNWWHAALCYLEGQSSITKMEETYDSHVLNELDNSDDAYAQAYLNDAGWLLRIYAKGGRSFWTYNYWCTRGLTPYGNELDKPLSGIEIEIGGSLQVKVIYQTKASQLPCKFFVRNTSVLSTFTQRCLPMSGWDKLYDCFKKSGAVIIFRLTALNGRSFQGTNKWIHALVAVMSLESYVWDPGHCLIIGSNDDFEEIKIICQKVLDKIENSLHYYHFTQNQIHVSSSKYLARAQELLNEFFNFCTMQMDCTPMLKIYETNQLEINQEVCSMIQFLYYVDLLELQESKSKLHQMLEEIDRWYKHYCDQMKFGDNDMVDPTGCLVKWMSINTIGQVSTNMGLELQYMHYEKVTTELENFIWDPGLCSYP